MLRIIFTCCLLLNLVYGEKSVAIITYKVANMNPWDPDTIKSGIVGGEESVIYMSQELAKLGYKVSVFGNAPENSSYSSESANPRFLSTQPTPGSRFDIVISWRMPELADTFREFAPQVYLWPHDILDGRSITEKQASGFDDVLWLSEWQRGQWCSVNAAFSRYKNIYGNGIEPSQFQSIEERKNPYSCIYGSNYARGLEILLNIWPTIKLTYPLATLDIYYGWEHWGLLSSEKEARMRQQVKDLAPLDVREHGLVSHEELNKAYAEASFWTYPCTHAETFCITALRAQLAGCIPVIIEGSALSETVRGGFKCREPGQYLSVLMKAMDSAKQITLIGRKSIGEFVLKEFTWKEMAVKWKKQFESDEKASKAAGQKFISCSGVKDKFHFKRLTPLIEKNKTGYTLISPLEMNGEIKNIIIICDKNFNHLSHQEMSGKIKPEATNCWIDNSAYDFSRFHAVAGPINFDGGYLMLVHEETEAEKKFDYHRFIYMDKSFNITRLSKIFTFGCLGVERCSSMVIDHAGEKLIFPIRGEESSVLCFFDLVRVRSMLEPLLGV